MKNNTKATEPKGGKREIAYPGYSLEEAVKIAEAVRDLGGARAPVSKSLLAKHLKYAETGPSFVQRLGAAKSFQLIKGWGAYSLTEDAQRYFYPTSVGDKLITAVNFLKGPQVFAKIINRFDGGIVPSVEMLGNTIHNESGIPASWKDKVASIFITSARFAGVLDSEGILRCNATLQGAAGPAGASTAVPPAIGQSGVARATVTDVNTVASQPEVKRWRREPPPPTSSPIRTWEFVDGDKALRVETPSQISSDLWQLLENYVQYLKPKEESK